MLLCSSWIHSNPDSRGLQSSISQSRETYVYWWWKRYWSSILQPRWKSVIIRKYEVDNSLNKQSDAVALWLRIYKRRIPNWHLSTLAPMEGSNHAIIAFRFIRKTKLIHPLNNRYRGFKRLDVSVPQDNLQQVNWEVPSHFDVDAHYNFLPHTILCATKHSNQRTVLKIYKQHAVIPNRTLGLLSRKSYCWAEYKRFNNGSCRQCKEIMNICTKAIRVVRLQYQIMLIDEFVPNPKSLFCYAVSLW